MSRDLSPTELRICRTVFASLAITVFAFLVFNAIDSLFNSATPVKMTRIRPNTNSTDRNSTQGSQSSLLIVQKGAAGGVVQEEPARASPSQMKAGSKKLQEMVLEKMIHFDPQPLEHDLVSEHTVPKLTSTEIPQPQGREKVATANAGTEPPSIELSQETKPQPEPDRSPQRKSNETLISAESLTYEHVLQIRSRLHDLGFLSATKGGGWDAS